MTVKIKAMGESHRVSLLPGDMIEVGTSHQLRIDNDDTWVSYKVATKVQDGETADQAHERVMAFQMAKVAEAVTKTAANVQKISGGK